MEAGLIILEKFQIKIPNSRRKCLPHIALVLNTRQDFWDLLLDFPYIALENGVLSTTTGYLPGRLGRQRTILESGQSTSIGAALSQHNPSVRGGVGNGWQRNTQAAAAQWSKVGQPQGEGARATLQRNTELQCQKHVAKLLTAENPQQWQTGLLRHK